MLERTFSRVIAILPIYCQSDLSGLGLQGNHKTIYSNDQLILGIYRSGD